MCYNGTFSLLYWLWHLHLLDLLDPLEFDFDPVGVCLQVLQGLPNTSSRWLMGGVGHTHRFRSWSYIGVTCLIFAISGRFSPAPAILDTDLDGTRTICRATPRAWRAIDLKTQRAGLGMLWSLTESVSLRECVVITFTSLEVKLASLTELLKSLTI